MADEEERGESVDPQETRACNKRDACCAFRSKEHPRYGTHRVPLKPGEPTTFERAARKARDAGDDEMLEFFGGDPDAPELKRVELQGVGDSDGFFALEAKAETLDSQVNRLASFIMREVDGEPSASEGAIDTAIRIMRGRAQAPTAAEALFGFMGWLTTREEKAGPFSGRHNAAQAAELVGEYCETKGIDPAPRPGWGTIRESDGVMADAHLCPHVGDSDGEDECAADLPCFARAARKFRGGDELARVEAAAAMVAPNIALCDPAVCGHVEGTKAPSSKDERAEADLAAIDGLETRAAAAFQLTKDAEVADLAEAFDGGATIKAGDLGAAEYEKQPHLKMRQAHIADGVEAGVFSPEDEATCSHRVTRVDANLIEKLGGDRVLEVTARCEQCRHRWVFNLRDTLGITLNESGTIARLDVVLGELDTMRVCLQCHKDHDGMKEICPACLSEAAAVNKEARDR